RNSARSSTPSPKLQIMAKTSAGTPSRIGRRMARPQRGRRIAPAIMMKAGGKTSSFIIEIIRTLQQQAQQFRHDDHGETAEKAENGVERKGIVHPEVFVQRNKKLRCQ